MRHAILHHLQGYHKDVENEVAAQLEHAIETYDFQGKVTEAVHAAIDSAIEQYFKYGDGLSAIYHVVIAKLDEAMTGGKNDG